MEGSNYSNVDSDKESVVVTTKHKQKLLKSEYQSLNIDLPSSSDDDNSFVASLNEGYESPISSWDSETDIPSVINCHDMPEEPFEGINHPDMEELNQFVGVENTDNGFVWEMDNISYEELMKKFIEKEEELRVSNFKLQLSEQKILKLSVKVDNREGQLHYVREELKLKEEELHKQKENSEVEIFMLKSEIEKSENRLDIVQEGLKLKEEELHKLKEHLEEEIFKLKREIKKSVNRLDNVQEELKLKEEELHKQKEHSEEEIFKLRIEIEKRDNRLDNVQKESKVEMEKLQKHIAELHTTQQMALQDEVDCLREELGQKREYTEISSKVLDNVVIIKRDEATANIDKLKLLLNLKKHVKDLEALIEETAVNFETAQNELKLEMGDVVKELTRQNAVMVDKDEEKREAIRQLCSSLDYYQNAYREVKEINKIYRSRCERNIIAS